MRKKLIIGLVVVLLICGMFVVPASAASISYSVNCTTTSGSANISVDGVENSYPTAKCTLYQINKATGVTTSRSTGVKAQSSSYAYASLDRISSSYAVLRTVGDFTCRGKSYSLTEYAP